MSLSIEPSARVLVVGPAWVGDMVMAQSLFKTLKHQTPSVSIDVLAPLWCKPLLDRMPEVDQALESPFKHQQFRLKARFQLGRSLQRRYQQAFVLPNSFKSALVPFFARISKRTGWVGEMRYGLLNDARPLNKRQWPKMVERFVALAYPKDIAALPHPILLPVLHTSEVEKQKVAAEFKVDNDKSILILCPGAEFGPSKQWPADYYAKVANEVLQAGWQVWILGSSKDAAIADTIQHQTAFRCCNFAGKTTLTQAIDLMSFAKTVITNDSGLMHIAAALDKSVIALYGSSSSEFTPPLTTKASLLSANVPCRPCFKRECPLEEKENMQCMHQIAPQRVLEKLLYD